MTRRIFIDDIDATDLRTGWEQDQIAFEIVFDVGVLDFHADAFPLADGKSFDVIVEADEGDLSLHDRVEVESCGEAVAEVLRRHRAELRAHAEAVSAPAPS